MSKQTRLIICFCLLIGLLILVHQYIFYGIWFELTDIHHETFSIAFFFLALGILLGANAETGKP